MKNNHKKDIHLEGVKVSTTFCGIKKTPHNEDDILLVEFDKPCSIAGVFTKSLTSSASVNQSRSNLSSRQQATVRAIVVNSGNANAFTGKLGEKTVLKISKHLSKLLKSNIDQIYTASTGVIGEQLDSNKIINSLNSITSYDTQNWLQAAHAIKTTDTFPKIAMRTCKIDNVEINIVGIAKGSGMIAPDMATMLGFIFTNANLPSDILQKLLKEANETSFNSITVKGMQEFPCMCVVFDQNPNAMYQAYTANLNLAESLRRLPLVTSTSKVLKSCSSQVEAIEKTTRVNMKVLQSRNKRRTLEKRMHST